MIEFFNFFLTLIETRNQYPSNRLTFCEGWKLLMNIQRLYKMHSTKLFFSNSTWTFLKHIQRVVHIFSKAWSIASRCLFRAFQSLSACFFFFCFFIDFLNRFPSFSVFLLVFALSCLFKIFARFSYRQIEVPILFIL